MSKKFIVSLAVSIPYNWECTVEAENEHEAYLKAEEIYNEDTTGGELKETDAPMTLDLSDPDTDGAIPNGVNVEQA